MNGTGPESYQAFETLPARVMAIVGKPRALFSAVIARPRFAAVMLLTFLVTAGCRAAFMETAVGQQALVDQWERAALAFGRAVTDEEYGKLVALSQHGAAYAALSALAGGPVLTVVVAGAVRVVAAVARWGKASYRQLLAIVAHGGIILMLRDLVVAPLNYARETLAGPTTLAQLVPILDEASPAARFLGMIDLFLVWWVIVLGIGMALLYRRPTRETVLAFMGAYVAFALVLALAMVVTGGTA